MAPGDIGSLIKSSVEEARLCAGRALLAMLQFLSRSGGIPDEACGCDDCFEEELSTLSVEPGEEELSKPRG